MAHGTVTITAPTTGATWIKDQSQRITWSVARSLVSWNNFGIYLLKNGATEATVATGLGGGLRAYNYTPPTSLDTASDYAIQIVGNYNHGGV